MIDSAPPAEERPDGWWIEKSRLVDAIIEAVRAGDAIGGLKAFAAYDAHLLASVTDDERLDVERLAEALHATARHNHNLGEGLARAICASPDSHQQRAEAIVAEYERRRPDDRG